MKTRGKKFVKSLFDWHKLVDRDMPWTKTSDPYAIWLSEVILQQTRVETGKAYYEKLLRLFPDVQTLAKASEDEVLASWKGLGYYSRARNLHASAKMICNEFGGVFPKSYDEIISLKGIGPYAAAAIGSFAFNLPHAVVDGNVYRVLSRLNNIQTPTDTAKGKKLFHNIANEWLPPQKAGAYNQAIMDFGALVCKPIAPKCDSCPMYSFCEGYQQNTMLEIPVRSKKIKITKRHFRYAIILNDNKVFLRKREANDIWKGLWEPPMIETSSIVTKSTIADSFSDLFQKEVTSKELSKSNTKKQQLSHQLVHGYFYQITLPFEFTLPGKWVDLDTLDSVGTPRIVDHYLQELATTGLQGELF